MQRRRRREAATFANPALLPNLVTGRPGWRRHLPPLLILLALGALVVALARPQRTVAAPQRAATVMMVTDISGSMNANDVEPDRLTAAVKAAHRLTDQLPETFRLGLVTFADFAEVQAPPTTDRDAGQAPALDRLRAEGGTAMATGLERALELARTPVPDENGTGTRRLPVRARAAVRRQGHAEHDLAARGRPPGASSCRSRSSRSRSARRAARSRCATSSASCSASRCRPTPRRCARSRASPAARYFAAPDAARLRVDLRQPRHPALLAAGRARGHRGLRRRRGRAAAGRRSALARLVRPPPLMGRPTSGYLDLREARNHGISAPGRAARG